MKHKPLALLIPLVLCAVFAALGFLPGIAAEKEASAKRTVLIIDGQNNHQWQQTTPVLKDALESCGRFEVTVSTSPQKGASKDDWAQWNPDFAKYDAVLSNYNGELWPENVCKAFEAYVAGGGAFVVVHAANNSFPQWAEYNKMIGLGGWGGRNEKSGPYLHVKEGKLVRDTAPGGGGSHGAQHEFNVVAFQPEHPIVKGMPASWKHAKDELYDSLRGPAENVEVLGYAHSDKSGKNEPMIMTISYGKGRVFHTPMGHADYSMRCVGFYSTLQRGTEWAITGKVTIPLPEKFPTADAVLPIAP
jgi:type 1 glutamine amidotransferase